jgi:hypothetical protein
MWKMLVENTYEEQKISTDSAHMTWTAPTQEMLFCVVFNLWVLISEAVVLCISTELLRATDSAATDKHTSFVCRKKKINCAYSTLHEGVFFRSGAIAYSKKNFEKKNKKQ